ncbi:MAG: methionyl-tRNA formyltransferase [Clostridia bacterium]|nr:methionyl-tRNA formyltransferase [Clostridia bacterium]
MKILFMGTPDFALESLKSIYEAGHEIIAVVTNPDRPKGRGMKMVASPVKEYAIQKNIKVYQPEKVKKNEAFIEEIKSLNPELICVVAYGKILPKNILDIPKYGSVNVHGSLLPKYRGAAPIQWSVLNGDKVTGVTTMYMDIGMDEGDIILKREVEIGDDETTGELWNRLSKLGGELLVETIKKIEDGTAPRVKQGEDYSMAPMLDKEMAKIDWENKSAAEIKNLVRGLNPIMGAYTFYEGKKIKFWKVETYTDDQIINMFPELEEFKDRFLDLPEGTILFSDSKTGLYIKAKDGNIKVIEIQGENAKRMSSEEFLRGNSLVAGLYFE